jgi:hypothetical protein
MIWDSEDVTWMPEEGLLCAGEGLLIEVDRSGGSGVRSVG